MADTFKPLFNPKLLGAQIGDVLPVPTREQQDIVNTWARAVTDPAFQLHNEKPLQGQFLQEVFGRLLGYHPAVGHLDAYHLKVESASTETKGSKTPDGRLGFFGHDRDHTRAVIELKAPAANLDAKQPGYGHITPVEQAFGYLAKFDDCRWVIVSNFVEIRLYSKKRGQGYGHSFPVAQLTEPEILGGFLYLLGRPQLIAEPPANSPVDDLLDDSTSQEQEITRRFYAFYKDLRLKLFRHLRRDNPAAAGSTEADHDIQLLGLAQKILDRVLFICFCEDTGLLPAKVIEQALAAAGQGFVHTSRWQQLRGLFQAVDKGHPPARINGYNGGLFAPDPVLDALTVADDILTDVLALSRYDFLTDVNVNILGHIFEQSISDLEAIRADIQGQTVDKTLSKRKQEGVFYTPEYITQYIVANTIGTCLAERFAALEAAHHPDTVRGANKQHAARVALWQDYQDTLRSLKILDPACGSGAFLIAAFDYLHAEYARTNGQLAALHGGQPSLFDLDKQILQQNLYGVDLNPESVEITKLSLWLKTARTDKPLNNLDGNIRCGNSLVSPHPVLAPELAARAFAWPAAFPFPFDVVIGNPPYIRQEWLAPYKPAFQREFAIFAGTADAYLYFFERGLQLLKPGGYLGYITSGTFANANFAKPFRDWLPTVARYTTMVNFGENQPFADAEMVYPTISIFKKDPEPRPFRYYFMSGAIPDAIADAVVTDGIDCDETVFGQAEWRFQPAAVTHLFNRLMAAGRPLGDVVEGRMYRGVLTGLNDAFIVDQATRDRLVAEDPACAPILKKLLRGEDLRPWYYEDENRWLIFTRRGIDIDRYPAVRAYLEPFRERLEPRPDDWPGSTADWPGRKPGPYKWYEIQDSVDYYDAFDEPKIFWPDICKLPRFSWDDTGAYCNDKGFIISFGEPWLLAVLQSRVAWFCTSQTATPLRLRGGLWQSQCKKQFVERLPIPDTDDAERQALGDLAMQATATARERYALHEQVRHRLLTDLDDGTHQLNQKLTTWWDLDFRTLRTELKKALKTDIPLAERHDWETALAAWQADHRALTARLVDTETAINDRVYQLFQLTGADRRLLEDHMQAAQIFYPLGEV